MNKLTLRFVLYLLIFVLANIAAIFLYFLLPHINAPRITGPEKHQLINKLNKKELIVLIILLAETLLLFNYLDSKTKMSLRFISISLFVVMTIFFMTVNYCISLI